MSVRILYERRNNWKLEDVCAQHTQVIVTEGNVVAFKPKKRAAKSA